MKSFSLLLITFIFSLTAFARYDTPGTFVKWNLDSLVQYSGGAVTFNSGSYQVNDLVLISVNDTLNIASNATVKFATATYLDVSGTLNINPPDSVLFTAQNVVSGYMGVRINFSNVSVMRKLTLEYAIGLRLNDCSPLIDSCIFRYNSFGSTTTFASSAITLFRSNSIIRNCRFLDNQRAAIAGGSNVANAPKIINNLFRGNNTQNNNVPQINLGISGSDTVRIINNQILRASTRSGGIGFLPFNGNVYVVITGNVIKNNRYGISFQGGSNINSLVNYNQVDSNNTEGNPNLGGSGIAFSGGTATSQQNSIVTGNLFRWNLWGITIQNRSKPNLGNITNTDTTDDGKNQFVGNTNANRPDIDLYNNSVDNIEAQNNYWGTSDVSIAESHIFHYTDADTLGVVNYLPLYSPLPVTLTAFTAVADKDNIILNWKTLAEYNSDHFRIEKSNDGRIFQDIGKINASGNSASIRNYRFTDVNALQQSGTIYYRLKLVDKDGKFTYSQIVSIKGNGRVSESIVKLYPTIFSAAQVLHAEITSSKSQSVSIRFYHADGRLLAQESKIISTGKNVLTLSNVLLPDGVIYVKFLGEDFQEKMTIVKK